MKIGIINGVYADEGHDHLKTLELAGGRDPSYPGFRVDVIQAYLNPDNIRDERLLKTIRDKAGEYGLELITHAHEVPLRKESREVLTAHGTVLEKQEKKRVVIHYDQNLEGSEIVRAFRGVGITPYIENYHRGIIDPRELTKAHAFLGYVLDRSLQNSIGAVIDFGRPLGIKEGEEARPRDAVEMILRTYRLLVDSGTSVFFHTGGWKSYQAGRENWVSPGSLEDTLPHRKLLGGILSLKPTEGPLVIESENVEHAVEGARNLRRLLDELRL